MKRIGLYFLFATIIVGALSAQERSKRVSLKEVTGGVFRQETNVGEMRSLPDGEHYTAMNRERSMIVKYAYRTGNPVDTLFNVRTAREATFDSFDGYLISPTGHHIIVWRETEYIYRRSFRAVHYVYDVRRNLVASLSEGAGSQMIPTFSPDGRMCAFVKDNNIWIKKFDFDTEVQVTRDGETNKIRNGITDWVYEEEFSVTNLMAWSPNAEILAFVRFDESNVPEFSMQVYGQGTYPGYHRFKYPKAGEANSTVTLHSYNISTRETKTLNTPVDAESYIPRITFTNHSDQLAVMTLNRRQNVFNMYYANPKSGIFRLILREDNERYIDSDWLKSISFYKNCFTYVSEKDGYAHIYLHTPTGVMQRQVTQGTWDVTRLCGYDEATQTVYYESAEESPLRRSVYKINAKGVKTKLSTAEGSTHADFSANFAYFVNHHSAISTPVSITVNETKSLKTLRTLQDNAALKQRLADYKLPPQRVYEDTHRLRRRAKRLDAQTRRLQRSEEIPRRNAPVQRPQLAGSRRQLLLRMGILSGRRRLHSSERRRTRHRSAWRRISQMHLPAHGRTRIQRPGRSSTRTG